VAYFDIGKQKVVWILKCREQHEEAAGNALIHFIFSFNYLLVIHSLLTISSFPSIRDPKKKKRC
jgi:hypothetical protein